MLCSPNRVSCALSVPLSTSWPAGTNGGFRVVGRVVVGRGSCRALIGPPPATPGRGGDRPAPPSLAAAARSGGPRAADRWQPAQLAPTKEGEAGTPSPDRSPAGPCSPAAHARSWGSTSGTRAPGRTPAPG